ncbi:MAG TPA: winged helix-turn-helix domain-containing protein [Mycobacteriales bacterium]|nr:winged helix-turn-helix domain-containing protein [Mycobacteriales bacterium]
MNHEPAAPEPRPATRRAPTLEESRALAHPVRLRIIRELQDGPLTNNELAQRLGRGKATVLHHVRALLDTGFVAALPPRPGPRGSREQPYRGTGKSWTLALELGPDPGAAEGAMLAAFLEEVRSADDRLMQSRAVLRLAETELDELRNRLQGVLDDFAARPPTPGGRKVAVYLNLYQPGAATTPPAGDPVER